MDLEKIAQAQAETEASFKSLTTEPFDFGRALPAARFPQSFVDFYTGPHGHKIELEEEANWFLANIGNGPEKFMFDGLFAPDGLTSQNSIISESIYAADGSIILPPDHYAIGGAYGVFEMRLLINLDETSPNYGKIFLWTLSPDQIGTETNTRGIAPVADDIASFFAKLTTEDAL